MRSRAALRTTIKQMRKPYEDRLAALVEIPSVSMEPERKGDIRRCAETAAGYLRDLGAEVSLVDTGGFPLVAGRIVRDPSFPTVTVYNHLDVQPADPTEWRTSPFTFTRKGDRYFARGATDDKGPALAAFYGAMLAIEDEVPINIQFLWELEEEIGSPNFAAGLRKLCKGKRPFTTDSVAVSDTIWIAAGRPAIPYGLRGLMAFTVRLQTGHKDVHSGTTGGAARNPVGELADVIAACYDARTGKVKVPGFYRDVRPLSATEKKHFARAGFSRRIFGQAHELSSLRFQDDARLQRAIMAMPTFEVHGLTGGYHGPGVKTIVPCMAEAKLSTRLVPDQDPEKVFRAIKTFIKARCPDAEVTREGMMEPFLGELDNAYNGAAARAMQAAFGRPPAFVREGGSIGAVLTMKRTLGAPAVFLGLSLPEHGYHAINENFDWGQASGGIEMFYRYFFELGTMPRRSSERRARRSR